jgi:DNA invertase Pin-like site-specific DNA recombinase
MTLQKFKQQLLTTTKAVIYCRVSDEEQVKKGHGLKSQEAVCREFARYRGYEVIEVFHENLTGKLLDRPVMKELLTFLRRHKRSGGLVVIIDDISRFARNHRAHWPLRDQIKEAGGILVSPVVKFADDADSVLVEGMLVTMAQHQREKGAEQTKSRMRGRVLNGYWPFYTCRGYRHEHKTGEGKVLVRDEPDASIIQEALEGFASGRFQTRAEVRRFLELHPSFAKLTNQLVHLFLTRPIYAGYVGKPEWDIPLRKGQHEGLISLETFERIQERLKEKPKAPARKDIRADFPLRGMVCCAECNKPLTSCWSTSKTGTKHAYYMCFEKGCSRNRKSIRREKIEGEFEAMLARVTPNQSLVDVAHAMFKKAWTQRVAQAQALAANCKREAAQIERQIEKLLDRVVEAGTDSVVRAYEKRIAGLERQALVLREKSENAGQRKQPFDELFELAIKFLANPWNLWKSGKMEHRNLVLRLTFAERLYYCAKNGFRTPKTTFPFSILSDLRTAFEQVAEGVGLNSLLSDFLTVSGRILGLVISTSYLIFLLRWFQDFALNRSLLSGQTVGTKSGGVRIPCWN